MISRINHPRRHSFITEEEVSPQIMLQKPSMEGEDLMHKVSLPVYVRSSLPNTSSNLKDSDGHVLGVKCSGDKDESTDPNFREKNMLSEVELHIIKSGFAAIELLWKDVSMGSDLISAKLLRAIHCELGEIGSELFRRIFLLKNLPDQVITLPSPRCVHES